MYKLIPCLLVIMWSFLQGIAQEYVLHSENPFQIQLISQDSTTVALKEISPVNTQYHITVQVRDKITQQPIPDVTVTCKLQYYNAVVDLDNNTCKQESVDYQHLYQVTNAAGMAAFTANSFAMDSKGDEVFIQVEVVSSKYATNQASDVRFYNGASEVQFPVLLLDREAL